MNTASQHHIFCEWQFEQYPFECTCGATRPKAEWFDEYVLKCNLVAAQAVVGEQAKDESLWFVPETLEEDILQKALRRLHEAIEGKSPEECARAALAKADGEDLEPFPSENWHGG